MESNLKNKHEGITKCSSNKGLSGNCSILPRTKFCGGGQFGSPKSLTAATPVRWRSL